MWQNVEKLYKGNAFMNPYMRFLFSNVHQSDAWIW